MAERTTRRIKIACPGCGQKLDVTGVDPFSRVNCPVCSFDLIVPKWFSNYLLESPEGKGGMAVVYRALDIALDREVAIKIFNSDLASKGVSPDLFLHEARIAATINHPAVVPIYSCGKWEDDAYIVMEYMGGGTLEQALRRAKGRLPMMETCRWIRDVCEGLEAALELGIVHHDVKPANILINLDSYAKISDFGLSQVLSGASMSAFLDPTRMWLSPHYVSPEKILTGEEGPEGDIYSLGASFYHLLAGEPPFRSDDVQELVNMRTTRDPVSPDLVRPDITPAIAALILDMMNRDPAARPSYSQIVTRINDAVRAIMRTAPSPVQEAAPAPAPAVEPAPAQPKRPHKVISVPADRVAKKRRSFPVSHLPLLLILFFLVCSLCALVFLPRFVDKRSLLDAAPALKAIYGDLPPETFPFMNGGFFEMPLLDAELAFSDYGLPLDARYVAAWVSGMGQFLDAAPGAVTSVAGKGDHLRSAAALAGGQPPAADACCLAVLYRTDPVVPDVYFSPEQQVRLLMGRMIRSVYELEPGSAAGNGRIPDRVLALFGEFHKAFRALPDGSWLVRLYGPRVREWQNVLSGDSAPSAELEPVFRRLFSGDGADRGRSRDAYPPASGTVSGSPFGVESPLLPSGE